MLDSQMVRKLHTTYSHPNDVDLIVGGMAEKPVNDSIMIGPTFQCLIYEQFSRSRRTDRFFYDSAMQPHPFTSGKLNPDPVFCIVLYPIRLQSLIDRCSTEQLLQLRNASLARIFCDNGDNITHMQRNVFLKPQAG